MHLAVLWHRHKGYLECLIHRQNTKTQDNICSIDIPPAALRQLHLHEQLITHSVHCQRANAMAASAGATWHTSIMSCLRCMQFILSDLQDKVGTVQASLQEPYLVALRPGGGGNGVVSGVHDWAQLQERCKRNLTRQTWEIIKHVYPPVAKQAVSCWRQLSMAAPRLCTAACMTVSSYQMFCSSRSSMIQRFGTKSAVADMLRTWPGNCECMLLNVLHDQTQVIFITALRSACCPVSVLARMIAETERTSLWSSSSTRVVGLT